MAVMRAAQARSLDATAATRDVDPKPTAAPSARKKKADPHSAGHSLSLAQDEEDRDSPCGPQGPDLLDPHLATEGLPVQVHVRARHDANLLSLALEEQFEERVCAVARREAAARDGDQFDANTMVVVENEEACCAPGVNGGPDEGNRNVALALRVEWIEDPAEDSGLGSGRGARPKGFASELAGR